MRKLTSEEIREGAARFRERMAKEFERRSAEIDAELEARVARMKQPGAVRYKVITREPRVVEAAVKDATGKTWTATGPTLVGAYTAVVSELTKEAGKGNETAGALLRVIEEAPSYYPARKRRGPAQGGLL